MLTPCTGQTTTFTPSLEKGRRCKVGLSGPTNMSYKTLVSVHNLLACSGSLEGTSTRFLAGLISDLKSHHAIQGSNKRKDQLRA